MSRNSVTIIPHGSGDTEEITLGEDGFFPSLSSNEFRDVMRVTAVITDARVKSALISARLKIGADLKSLIQTHIAYDALDDVPAEGIDGVSVLTHRYRMAVYNEAKATLTERYRDIDSTQSGHDEADKLDATIDDYRQVSREHIRALLGKPRATVELL